jgi:hypothetical protein
VKALAIFRKPRLIGWIVIRSASRPAFRETAYFLCSHRGFDRVPEKVQSKCRRLSLKGILTPGHTHCSSSSVISFKSSLWWLEKMTKDQKRCFFPGDLLQWLVGIVYQRLCPRFNAESCCVLRTQSNIQLWAQKKCRDSCEPAWHALHAH